MKSLLYWLPLLCLLLAGCRPDSTPPIIAPPHIDDPDPPVMTAAVRLFPDDPVLSAGDFREFAEDLNTPGVLSVEWDFDYDGTTFTVDRTVPRPATSTEALRVYFDDAETVVVAVRGVYPTGPSPIGTKTLTVNPSPDAARFRPNQRDIGELRFEDPAYVSDYSNVLADGGQSIARNGNSLLAGYYAIKAGVPNYYVVGSNDLGHSWGTPVELAADDTDRPFVNRPPQLALEAFGDDFLCAWNVKEDDAVSVGRIVLTAGAPPQAVLDEVVPRLLTSPAGILGLPTLAQGPGSTAEVRLLVGEISGGTLAVVAANPALSLADPLNFATVGFYLLDATFSRLSTVWNETGHLIAYETVATTIGSGGGSATVKRRLHLAQLSDSPAPSLIVPRTLMSLEDSPISVLPFESRLAATANRYWVPCRFGTVGAPDNTSFVFTGSWDTTTVGVPTVLDLVDDPDARSFAAVALPDGVCVLYTKPFPPDNPDIDTGRSDQLYAARFPLDGSAALYLDDWVNTDDPDHNEGHELPSIIAGPNGEALAVWVGAHFGRKANGRFSFNRTR